uniref:RNA-binding protein PNO1 n=1 Tax=Piliocolobus tephrosceles TaxID=591936 RepID=A0A8C9H1Y1_9PRIM
MTKSAHSLARINKNKENLDNNKNKNKDLKNDNPINKTEEDSNSNNNNTSSNVLTLENVLQVANPNSEDKKVKNKLILKKNKNNDSSSIITKNEMRIITIPKHRISSIKKNWFELIKPIVTHLKLEIRMNKDKVEVRTCKFTEDKNNLQKASDYIKAYLLGFCIEDSLALLRIEDLYIESFEIKDVKILKGDHLSRCIGRICGSNGATKFAIENATKTRIVIAGTKIHILGSFNNIKMARHSICSLIIGSTQGKIFNK